MSKSFLSTLMGTIAPVFSNKAKGSRSESPSPKLALVLGGGAARGFAHIGVIKMLIAQGIVPDMVVGSSAGAVVGALYVSGLNAYAMQNIATQMDASVFTDWGLPKRGVMNGTALEEFINKHLENRLIEDLPMNFAVVATELQTGEMKVFNSGNTGAAVRASASVPGLYKPVTIDGKVYVDGGLVSPVPIDAARSLGADIVIAVDISTRPELQPIDSITNILWQTISIMGEKISQNEAKRADFLIKPYLPHIKFWDFEARNRAIIEGEKAALAVIPNIHTKLHERGWCAQNRKTPFE